MSAPDKQQAQAATAAAGLSDREIRLRCIEAAARAPIAHNDGPAAGVLAVAAKWYDWVKGTTLGLPGK